MKSSSIVLVLCTNGFVGCVGCDKPNQIPDPPPITFGCRARGSDKDVSRGMGKKEMVTSSTESTQKEAVESAVGHYRVENPGTNPNVNCWPCSQNNLGQRERATCDMVVAGILE